MKLSIKLLLLLAVLFLIQKNTYSNETVTFDHLSDLYEQGKFDDVVKLSEILLESDSARGDVITMQVGAALYSDSGLSFIDEALNSPKEDLITLYRKAVLHYHMGRIVPARNIFRDIVTKYPDYCWAHEKLGRIACDIGDTALAFEHFSQAKTEPRCESYALFYEGHTRALYGQFDLSDSLYDSSLVLNPNQMMSKYGKVWIMLWRGNWQAGLDTIDNYLKEKPYSGIFKLKARMYRHLGQISKSREVMEKALALYPDNILLKSFMSVILGELGQYSKSREYSVGFSPRQCGQLENSGLINEAMILDDTLMYYESTAPAIHYNYLFDYSLMPFIYWLDTRDRKEEADSIYNEILEVSTEERKAYLLASRMANEDPYEALRIIDSLLPNRSQFDKITQFRVDLLIQTGKIDEAMSLIQGYLDLYPGALMPFVSFAGRLIGNKRLSEAERLLDHIDSIIPMHADAVELRLGILIEQGKFDEARKLTEALAAQYPTQSRYLMNYFILYDSRNDKEYLSNIVSRFLPHAADDILLATDITNALISLERGEEAEVFIEELIDKYPNAAFPYSVYGYLQTSLGRHSRSENYYKKAFSLNPYNPMYSRGQVGTTLKGANLDSYKTPNKVDTTGLERFSVGQILEMAKNRDEKSIGKYGGIILYHKSQVIHKEYGQTIRREHLIAYLDTKDAAIYYGNRSFSFNAFIETPFVLSARAIAPDGSITETQKDQIFISMLEDQSNSDYRKLGWSQPGADSGAILEFIVQFEGEHMEPYDFFYSFMLNEIDPIMRRKVMVQVPKSWDVTYDYSKDLELEESKSGNSQIMEWTKTDLKPLVLENNCPVVWEQSSAVYVGYRKTWKEEADWYWGRISDKIDTGAGIIELANNLIADSETQSDTILKLFDYVTDEIRYEAIEFGDGSYFPRKANQTIKNGYGDCKDKSVLYLSLLNAVGIEAYPVLIATVDTGAFSVAIPSVKQFKHFIVYFPGLEKFSDPTCEFCSPFELSATYNNKPSLLLNSDLDDPLVFTGSVEISKTHYSQKIRFKIGEDGKTKIKVNRKFRGEPALHIENYMKFSDSVEIDRFFKEDCASLYVSRANLVDYSFGRTPNTDIPEFLWSFDFIDDSLAQKDYKIIEIPVILSVFGYMTSLPDTSNRRLDVMLDQVLEVEEEYFVDWGRRWELNNNRLDWEYDTTWFNIKCASTEWNDSIRINLSLKMKTNRIPADEYDEFYRLYDKALKKSYQQSVMIRRKPSEFEVRSLKDFVKTNPSDISIVLTLVDFYLGDDEGGLRCRSIERRDEARKLLAQAISHAPDNEMVSIRLAALYMRDKMYAAADSVMEAFASKYKSASPYFNYMRIAIAEYMADYDKQIELMNAILSQMPSEELRSNLAVAYINAGDYASAHNNIELLKLIAVDKASVLRPEFQYHMAMEQYDSALILLENWPDTNIIKSIDFAVQLAIETGEYDPAVKLSLEMLEMYPDNPLMLNNAAWILGLSGQQLDQALAYVNDAIALNGECDPMLKNTRGVIYFQMGKITEAKREFNQSLKSQSIRTNCIDYYYLGKCSLVEGKKDEAIEYFTKAFSIKGEGYFVKLARKEFDKLKQ